MKTILTTALLAAAALSLTACSGNRDAGNITTENTVLLNDEGVAEEGNFTAIDPATGNEAMGGATAAVTAGNTAGELSSDNAAVATNTL